MKSWFKTGAALLVAAGAACAVAETTSTPRLLVNMKGRVAPTASPRAALTGDEAGWTNWTQDNDPYIPTDSAKSKYLNNSGVCAAATEGIKFRVNHGNGNHRSEWGNPSGKTFVTGSYTNIFGQTKESLIEEVKSSLNLPQGTDFTTNVWDAGIGNGGEPGGNGEIVGLDPAKKYVIYIGIAKQVQNEASQGFPAACGGLKLTEGKYGDITSLQYVVTDGLEKTAGGETIHTVQAAQYTTFEPGTRVGPAEGGLMIVRYVGKPNSEGQVCFKLGGVGAKADKARSGMAFVAVSEIIEDVQTYTATVSGSTEVNWSALTWSPEKPQDGFGSNSRLTIAMPDNATLVFDEVASLPECTLTITGTGVKIKAADKFFTDGCYETTILSCGAFNWNSATADALKAGFNGAYTLNSKGIKLRAQNREVISINIAGGNGGDAGQNSAAANTVSGSEFYGLYPTVGESWNNIDGQWQSGGTNRTLTINGPKAYTGNETPTRASMTLSATGKNTWQANTIANPFLRGYLDDGGGVNVNVTGIPYNSYDVIVYATSDESNILLAPITVNGTQYTYKDGATVPGNTVWGAGLYATPEIGKNALLITNQASQTLTISSQRTSGSGNNGRGTLCAVQIINRGDAVLEQTTLSATIDAGTTTGSLTTITYDSAFAEGLLNAVKLTVNGTANDAEYVLTIDKADALLEKIVIDAPNGRKVKIEAASEVAKISRVEFNTLAEVSANFKGTIVVVAPGKFKYVVDEDAEYPYGPIGGTGDAILGAAEGKTLTIKKTVAAEYTFGDVTIPSGTVKIGTDANDPTYKFAARSVTVDGATFELGSRDSIDNVRALIVTNNACLKSGAYVTVPVTTLYSSRIELTGGWAGNNGNNAWKGWNKNGKISAYGDCSIVKTADANAHTCVQVSDSEFWVAEGSTLNLSAPVINSAGGYSGTNPNQLRKTGPGTMIYTANLNAYYSGHTTVAEGKLVYNNPRTGLTTANNFNVAAGATLAGNGTIKGAAIVKLQGENATLAGTLAVDNVEVADGAAFGSAADPITNLTIGAAITAAAETTPTIKVANGTAVISGATVAEGVAFNVVSGGVLDIGGKRDLTLGGEGALAVSLGEEEAKNGRLKLFNTKEGATKQLTIAALTFGEKNYINNCRGIAYAGTEGFLKIAIRGMMLILARIGL